MQMRFNPYLLWLDTQPEQLLTKMTGRHGGWCQGLPPVCLQLLSWLGRCLSFKKACRLVYMQTHEQCLRGAGAQVSTEEQLSG